MYTDILENFIKNVTPFNTLPLDVKSVTPYDFNIHTVLANDKKYAIIEIDYIAGNEFATFNDKISKYMQEKVLKWIPLIKAGHTSSKVVSENDSDDFIFRKNNMNYAIAEVKKTPKTKKLSPTDRLNQAIEKLYDGMTDRYDFCHKLISLDLDKDFGNIFEQEGSPVAELFNLCIQYLDKTVKRKSTIWEQIEKILKNLV